MYTPNNEVLNGSRCLLEASLCGISSSVTLRAQLRKLATPVLEAHADELVDAMRRSPLMATERVLKGKPGAIADKMVKVRNYTVAALRDMLTVLTLFDLLDERCEGSVKIKAVERVKLAITDPDDYARVASGTKTGFVIGQHRALASFSQHDRLMKARAQLGRDGWPVPEPGTVMLRNDNMLIDAKSGDLYDVGLAGASGKSGKSADADDGVPAASEPKESAAVTALKQLDPKLRAMIDNMMSTAELPSLGDLTDELIASQTEKQAMRDQVKGMQEEFEGLRKAAAAASAGPVVVAKEVEASGEMGIPAGRTKTVAASDVFPFPSMNWQVPAYEWDGEHPHVPAADPNYIFREDELKVVIDALIANEPIWLQGHTGSGKTTLIEQVCARLNWPWVVVSLDAHVGRSDLLGNHALTAKDGASVSEWLDGIVPKAMKDGYLICFDELDAIDKEVAYVLQRVVEGGELRLLEDGGRMVKGDPMYRMVATANTNGMGDEHGMYPATSPQSSAFLDRFTRWVEVDYMDEKLRKQLIKSTAPGLSAKDVALLSKYVTEHQTAFTEGQVMLPITPRGYKSMAKVMAQEIGRGAEPAEALRWAVKYGQLNRALSTDRAVLQGLLDRVAK